MGQCGFYEQNPQSKNLDLYGNNDSKFNLLNSEINL